MKLDFDKKVKIYFNSTKCTYSIQQNSKVCGHTDDISLMCVNFWVNQNGRHRVFSRHRKEVHAYVIGLFMDYEEPDFKTLDGPYTYSPYKNSYFYHTINKNWVFGANYARLIIKDKKPEIWIIPQHIMTGKN